LGNSSLSSSEDMVEDTVCLNLSFDETSFAPDRVPLAISALDSVGRLGVERVVDTVAAKSTDRSFVALVGTTVPSVFGRNDIKVIARRSLAVAGVVSIEWLVPETRRVANDFLPVMREVMDWVCRWTIHLAHRVRVIPVCASIF